MSRLGKRAVAGIPNQDVVDRALVIVLISLTFGLLWPSATTAAAGPTYRYTFETHAAFFSAETRQPNVVDPQVFVADPSAAAATGPQNIPHVAGYRPARPGSDPANTPLFTAQGHALNLTLGDWLGASGTGTITCDGDSATATNQFQQLVPGKLYQLTRLQFTPAGPKRSPLGKPDGSDSTFVAGQDGSATFTNQLPFCPDASEGVVLAYHSDGTAHGAAMGEIGVNLHNQLAGRIVGAVAPQTGRGATHRLVWVGLASGLLLLVGVYLRRKSSGKQVFS